MSVDYECINRINSLKQGIESTTGKTYDNLTLAVQELKNKYNTNGGSSNNELNALIERSVVEIYNDEIIIIGNNTFNDCISLTTADFPMCETIRSSAFLGCTALTTLNFPVCTSIGVNAFSHCMKLTTADFPACETIGMGAFSNCTSLTTLSFPACETIGSYAFCNCPKLTTADFPACKTIGTSAFSSCTALTTANFPVCKTIGSYAFCNCSKLTSVICSASYIYSRAFYSCSRLMSFTNYYPSVATLQNRSVFYSTPMSNSTYKDVNGNTQGYGSIYVPASLVASYKTATNWASYAARITSIPE